MAFDSDESGEELYELSTKILTIRKRMEIKKKIKIKLYKKRLSLFMTLTKFRTERKTNISALVLLIFPNQQYNDPWKMQ